MKPIPGQSYWANSIDFSDVTRLHLVLHRTCFKTSKCVTIIYSALGKKCPGTRGELESNPPPPPLHQSGQYLTRSPREQNLVYSEIKRPRQWPSLLSLPKQPQPWPLSTATRPVFKSSLCSLQPGLYDHCKSKLASNQKKKKKGSREWPNKKINSVKDLFLFQLVFKYMFWVTRH